MQLEKPILGTVKAGYGLFAEQNLDGYVNVSQEDYNNGDYFLRVSGDSMIGEKIHDQDLLYVKAMDDVPSGTIAVVLIGGDEVSVKKLIKKKDYWILQAANPNVEPRIFTLQEVEETPVRVIGKVLYARSEIA
jgi:repressor LexA